MGINSILAWRTLERQKEAQNAYHKFRAQYETALAEAKTAEAKEQVKKSFEKALQKKERDLLQTAITNPSWSKSFLLGGGTREIIDLPSAYQDLVESLSPELSTLLDSIYEELGDSRGVTLSGRRSLASLAEILLDDPEMIRNIDGMTELLLQELTQKLREKGHLRQ